MNARSCRDYKVGWICALPTELAASICMLDEKHSPPSDSPQDDPNNYSYGAMKGHDVVLACLPKGIIGETAAAIAAERMRSTFPSIKFALLVGIGGGIPSPISDIRLGDVVVSVPANEHPGVIQYDVGKTGRDGKFIRTGSLNRPPDILLNAVATLESRHLYQDTEVYDYVLQMLEKYKRMEKGSCHQGVENDQLFKLEFEHVENEEDCAACLEDQEALVPRQMRESNIPNIFYGLIASGNQVIKHGATRDRFRKELKVLCFEMEAAGVLNVFPSLVIRGICDYADSHKNKHWQGYAAATAAAYAKELLCVIPPERVLHTSSGGETVRQSMTIMPLARDLKFVGREHALNQIKRVHSQSQALRRVAVIGLGGVGKTAIAIEHAYRCKDADPELSLFWVHASSAARFLESYISIAERLKLPGWDDSKVDKLRLVHRWLASEESGRWLLILDNLDDAGLVTGSDTKSESNTTHTFTIPQYLPQNGSIIITSRYKGAALPLVNNDSSCIVRVGVMESAEAVRLLQSRLGTEDNTQAELEGLAEELEYIPLAITQASAYIAQSEMTSVATYLSDLRSGQDEQSNLLSTIWIDLRRDADTAGDGDEGMNAVIRTWQTSFRQIEKRNPLAADLLGRMSMFDRQNISSSILFDGDPDARECREALDLLLGFSFIAKQTNKTSFNMHRSVQLAMKTWLRMRFCYVEQRERALRTFENAYPYAANHRDWPTFATLEPHVDAILLDEDVSPSASLDRASLLLQRAYYTMCALGSYYQALAYAKEVVAIRERQLGKSHIDTLRALCCQFVALGSSRDYYEAIRIGNIATAGFERALGADHEETLYSKTSLLWVWSSSLRSRAQILRRRDGLALSVDIFSSEHGEPFDWAYMPKRLQGSLKGADGSCVQPATDIYTVFEYLRDSEQDDEPALIAMGALATILSQMGQHHEAEVLQKLLIEGHQRSWGKEHPGTLRFMHNLAIMYTDQGRLGEAASMLTPLLATSKRVNGPAHPDTLATMYNSCLVFAAMDRLEEARSMLQQTLDMMRVTLGLEHLYTLSCMSSLACVWWDQGLELGAIRLMQQTFELRVKVSGASHDETKNTKEWLEYFLDSTTTFNMDDYLRVDELAIGPEISKSPVIDETRAGPAGSPTFTSRLSRIFSKPKLITRIAQMKDERDDASVTDVASID